MIVHYQLLLYIVNVDKCDHFILLNLYDNFIFKQFSVIVFIKKYF